MQEVDKIQDKIKFTSFGKTKIKSKQKQSKKKEESNATTEMMLKQVRLEEQISKVTSSKEGRCGKVLK